MGADESVDRVRGAITNGSIDDGDDGVVGLLSDGIHCTGTLVAPRVVLTAAHCLVATSASAVVVGADQGSGTAFPAVHAHVHPQFDSLSLANDVGLVLLGEPVPAASWPLRVTPLDASMVGTELRLVGYGQTAATDISAVRKRQGTGTLGSFSETELEILPGPSLTCGGDSGGPAFLVVDGTEYLAGVTSSGDCAELTRSMRVDAYRAFVDAFVAATAEGAAEPGQRCYYPDHCASGSCFFPADAPRIGYCSDACGDDGDCAAGMRCLEQPAGGRRCRYPAPSPGALGSPCESYSDCNSLLCARADAGGPGVCSVVCDREAPSCPSGFECLPDADQEALHACFERPASPRGCSAASGGQPTGLGWALLLLGFRRRRPHPRAGRAHN
jgi:MYXO-CTERM domain-containing protein